MCAVQNHLYICTVDRVYNMFIYTVVTNVNCFILEIKEEYYTIRNKHKNNVPDI